MRNEIMKFKNSKKIAPNKDNNINLQNIYKNDSFPKNFKDIRLKINPKIDPIIMNSFGIIILSKSIMEEIKSITTKIFNPTKFKLYIGDKEPTKKLFRRNKNAVRNSTNGYEIDILESQK